MSDQKRGERYHSEPNEGWYALLAHPNALTSLPQIVAEVAADAPEWAKADIGTKVTDSLPLDAAADFASRINREVAISVEPGRPMTPIERAEHALRESRRAERQRLERAVVTAAVKERAADKTVKAFPSWRPIKDRTDYSSQLMTLMAAQSLAKNALHEAVDALAAFLEA